MEVNDNVLQFQPFMAVTFGIIVLFVGKRLNESIGLLREFSIPEPVTGGLLFSVLFGLLYAATGLRPSSGEWCRTSCWSISSRPSASTPV